MSTLPYVVVVTNRKWNSECLRTNRFFSHVESLFPLVAIMSVGGWLPSSGRGDGQFEARCLSSNNCFGLSPKSKNKKTHTYIYIYTYSIYIYIFISLYPYMYTRHLLKCLRLPPPKPGTQKILTKSLVGLEFLYDT